SRARFPNRKASPWRACARFPRAFRGGGVAWCATGNSPARSAMKQICPLILRGVLTAPSIALLFLAGGSVWMKISSNWLRFIAETAGALTILWQGVPIYRRLLMGVTEQAGGNVFLWVLIRVAVISASFWIRFGLL